VVETVHPSSPAAVSSPLQPHTHTHIHTYTCFSSTPSCQHPHQPNLYSHTQPPALPPPSQSQAHSICHYHQLTNHPHHTQRTRRHFSGLKRKSKNSRNIARACIKMRIQVCLPTTTVLQCWRGFKIVLLYRATATSR
jgi:hypothetical protein